MNSVFRRLLCAGLVVLAMPGGARAYCVNYGESLRLVGTARLAGHGSVQGLAAISPVVYALGSAGHELAVLDFSDPGNVVEVLRVVVTGGITRVWAGGQTVILAYPGGGLVLDASDPFGPVVTDTLPVSMVGSISAVDIVGNMAYVASGTYGLLVLDVSVPTAVRLVGGWNPGRTIYGVGVDGNRAYVATGTQVDIVAIADPTHPVQSDSLVVPAFQLDIDSGTMVIVDGYNVVSMYEVGNNHPPYMYSRFRSGDFIKHIQLSLRPNYTLELVVCSTQKMEFFSVAGAFEVTRQGEVWNEAGMISTSEVVNDLVVNDGWEMGIFDPGLGGFATFRDHQPVPGGWPEGLAAAGNTAYVALGFAGLGVYDVSGPLNPVLVGSAPGSAERVKVQGNQVVTVGAGNLHVIDVTDPTLPVALGTVRASGRDLALDGHTAWVTDGRELVQGVDFSDPGHPVLATEFIRVNGTTRGLDAAHGILHVVDYDGTYELYSTATQPPTLLSTVATGQNLWDVTLDGDVAIVSSFMGLSFYRVSDPSAPQLLSEFSV